MHHELLDATRRLIAECECENGCPGCVGPVGNTGPLAKTAALRILDLLLAARAGGIAWTPATLRDRLRDVVRPVRLKPRRLPCELRPQSRRAASGFSRTSMDDVLGGAWRENARRAIVRRQRAGSRRTRRTARIASSDFAAGSSRGAVSRGARRAGRGARPPFVFFDLETTGLSGGAGTYAFLVGCGWFDADGGVRHRAAPDGRLRRRAVDARTSWPTSSSRAGALVTFNGKSFDAPVLETRYLFHRLESPCAALPHVDLLHPARRFWGRRQRGGLLARRRSKSRCLGVRRAGDVPGFEIPARYFQFVRSGDPRPLAGVLEHNRLDLLSLAGLTARLFHLVEAGPARPRTRAKRWRLGACIERAGLDERAEDAFERAVALSGPAAVGADARRRSRRCARWRSARAASGGTTRRPRCWRRLLDVPGCPRRIAREAIEALAIHHEHRARDLAAAKMFALRGSGIRRGTPRGAMPRGIASRESSGRWSASGGRCFLLRLRAAFLRLSDVCAPNFFVNRSTRPSVSISFCRPVKNGWQFEQISRCSSCLVERVFHVAPHAQRASTSWYLGWMPSFTASSLGFPGNLDYISR